MELTSNIMLITKVITRLLLDISQLVTWKEASGLSFKTEIQSPEITC